MCCEAGATLNIISEKRYKDAEERVAELEAEVARLKQDIHYKDPMILAQQERIQSLGEPQEPTGEATDEHIRSGHRYVDDFALPHSHGGVGISRWTHTHVAEPPAQEPCTCDAPPFQPCGPNCRYPYPDQKYGDAPGVRAQEQCAECGGSGRVPDYSAPYRISTYTSDYAAAPTPHAPLKDCPSCTGGD